MRGIGGSRRGLTRKATGQGFSKREFRKHQDTYSHESAEGNNIIVPGEWRISRARFLVFAYVSAGQEREGEPATDGSISCDVREFDLHDDWVDLHGGSPHPEAIGATSFGTQRKTRAPSLITARALGS